MNLLYLTFGNNSTIHVQAAFSIYSFLAQPQGINSVNIITDAPAFYKNLLPHVNIITLTENELSEWKGEHQFFWRIKIMAIKKIGQLYSGQPVIYLDTDTFLFGNILALQKCLQNGHALMHENEGILSGKKSKTEKKMWSQITGKKFGKILMQPTDCMWNAGVVAIPNTADGKDCQLALTICDEMCAAGITKRLIEQYSLSLALHNSYGLVPAKDVIAHYWSAKEIWNKQVTDFFMQAYFGQWNFERIITEMGLFDTGTLPIFQKIKNTNLRLKIIIDSIFPIKNKEYLHQRK